MSKTIKIQTKSASTKYVALDINDGFSILAEGRTIKSVIKIANDTGKEYSLLFIPKPGLTCIY